MDELFIFLSKLLPLLVYPVSLASLLIISALLLKNRPILIRTFLITAVLLLWIGGNHWFTAALIRSLEWQYLPQEEYEATDVLVLLGGGTDPMEYPRQIVEVNSAGDRVLYAAHLYRQGKAANILISGGNIDWLVSSPSTGAEDMALLLQMMGVPEDAIWLETESRNTYENAVFSQRILEEKGIDRVLLVTSAMHMPRSVKLFERQGLQVIPAPTDFIITQAGWENNYGNSIERKIINFFPSADNLSLTTRSLKEYIGMLIYKLRGWI